MPAPPTHGPCRRSLRLGAADGGVKASRPLARAAASPHPEPSRHSGRRLVDSTPQIPASCLAGDPGIRSWRAERASAMPERSTSEHGDGSRRHAERGPKLVLRGPDGIPEPRSRRARRTRRHEVRRVLDLREGGRRAPLPSRREERTQHGAAHPERTALRGAPPGCEGGRSLQDRARRGRAPRPLRSVPAVRRARACPGRRAAQRAASREPSAGSPLDDLRAPRRDLHGGGHLPRGCGAPRRDRRPRREHDRDPPGRGVRGRARLGLRRRCPLRATCALR